MGGKTPKSPKGKGGKGGCAAGDVSFLLTPTVYAKVQAAVNGATQVSTAAGPAMSVCLDCGTLNDLSLAVALAWDQNCSKKKKKGKKGGKKNGGKKNGGK